MVPSISDGGICSLTFSCLQDYGSEASLLPTTPRGIGRRSSPPSTVQPNVAGVKYGMDARDIQVLNLGFDLHFTRIAQSEIDQSLPWFSFQERLFIVRGISIVEVLADLKAMEDMVSTLEDVAAPTG